MNNDVIRVLMIDDDQEFTELVGEFLSGEGGFNFKAKYDGGSGVEAIKQAAYDVIVLDVGLPVMNGFDVLKAIRKISSTPIIMLTARGDDLDRILGLEIGADDYVAKPCHLRELVARIHAILRRVRVRDEKVDDDTLYVGDLRIEPNAQAVYRDGELVDLTGAEYLVLEVLLQSAGKVVEKDSIARHALGRRIMPYDRSVDAHIGHLRKKLHVFADGQPRIKTVRGRGYLYVKR